MALAGSVIGSIDGTADNGPKRRERCLAGRKRLDVAFLSAIISLSLLLLTTGSVAATLPELSCDLAALKAERDWNLPSGILSAVGTVESGRAGRAGVTPWPWTINAAGRGSHHDSKGDAVATVLAIMESGYPYIDVGCFQVDLAYHAGVFRSLEEAFDPDHNAQAAAQILLTNRMNSPDWNTAVARYHSATPERGNPYLQRVRNALSAAISRALTAQARSDTGEPAAPLTVSTQTGSEKLPIVIYGYPLSSPQALRSRDKRPRS